MARKYKKTSDGQRGSYCEKDMGKFQKACSDITSGKLSVRQAAVKYGFAKSTLNDAVTRKHPRKPGAQTVLSADVEDIIIKRLKTLADWGFPFDTLELRIFIKMYLDRCGITIRKFKNNLPGYDWARSFLTRHKQEVTQRFSQNIKVSRASVTPETIRCYFKELETTLKDVPPENIINYDETNLSDDPGRKKIIVRRACKYPERIMNATKASTSIMFACTASGTLLPAYVVYKSRHLYDLWTEGGPPQTRYNRTDSGWFDGTTFADWFFKTVLPYAKRQPGKKVIIGDNLASHVNDNVVEACEQNNIDFVLLPPNSTNLTQPLDVSVFRPMKGHWRTLLTEFKSTSLGRKYSTLPKAEFPKLLARLMERLNKNIKHNIMVGFRKCGIFPLNAEEVLSRVPDASRPATEPSAHANETSTNTVGPAVNPTNQQNDVGSTSSPSATFDTSSARTALDASLVEILSSFRYGSPSSTTRGRKRKLTVAPGKSVKSRRMREGADDITASDSETGNPSDPDDPSQVPENLPSTSRATTSGTSTAQPQHKMKKSTASKKPVPAPVRTLGKPTPVRPTQSSQTSTQVAYELREREIRAEETLTEEESTEVVRDTDSDKEGPSKTDDAPVPVTHTGTEASAHDATSDGREEEEVHKPKIHEWVIVKVCDERKNKKKHYMAVIIEVSPVLKVRFLKHVAGTKNVFVNSNIPGDECCEIDVSDIVMYVNEPKLDKRERMVFDVNVICWPK